MYGARAHTTSPFVLQDKKDKHTAGAQADSAAGDSVCACSHMRHTHTHTEAYNPSISGWGLVWLQGGGEEG